MKENIPGRDGLISEKIVKFAPEIVASVATVAATIAISEKSTELSLFFKRMVFLSFYVGAPIGAAFEFVKLFSQDATKMIKMENTKDSN